MLTLISPFLVILAGSLVSGLEYQRAIENENMPCFVPDKVMEIDINWVTKVTRWYMPFASILDMYGCALAMGPQDEEELSESDLYYYSCILWDVGEVGDWTGYAFHGHKSHYDLIPIQGIQIYDWTASPKNHTGRTYTTITDNKSYFFCTTCQMGRMTWALMTTEKTVTPEVLKTVHDHALSLGFKKKYFTEIKYDLCEDPTPNKKKGK